MSGYAPRILVIDDLFGRGVKDGINRERINLCGKFLLKDEGGRQTGLKIPNPTAKVVFCRGQSPAEAIIGDTVENDLEGTLATVRKGWTHALAKRQAPWAMVLLDLCFYTGRVTEASHGTTRGMPEGRPDDDDPEHYFGLVVLDALRVEFPDLPVVLLSSKPRDDVSRQFSSRGALAFIPRDAPNALDSLTDALWHHGLFEDPEGEVGGCSLPLLLALREARRLSSHSENVLIRGERGVGKELFARFINRCASVYNRKQRPFVTVNSAAFTSNLFSAELFGLQQKQGETSDRVGLIESAGAGDLFFDEIADMPPKVQAALLRVLQEKQITPVGGHRPLTVEARFLAATNSEIEEASLLRPDLLDRLRAGGSLMVPPLREREADILPLAKKFISEAESLHSQVVSRQISAEAGELLLKHYWPGNVRELRTVVFDAVIRNPNVEYLVPGHLRLYGTSSPTIAKPLDKEPTRHADGKETIQDLLEDMANLSFNEREVGSWAGMLERIRIEEARLLARYISAAISATKRRTPDNPDGVIQIHPAMKLATGNAGLTATQSADLLKRYLGPLEPELSADLTEALQIAYRLRPKGKSLSP